MANNLIQVKRTSVSGRAANSTTLPNPGELALNMTDGILYSTNGSVVFEVGANNTNAKVTGTLTVNTVSAGGSPGANNQRLVSNGSTVHWQDPLLKDLTDVAANGATDTQVLTYNSTLQKWINQNPPVANVVYTTGYYGVFYDLTASQYATDGSNTATVLQIANTYLGNGITRTSNNELQIGYDGIYQIQYSIQCTSSSNKNESIWVWLRKNGTDVPDSTTDFGIYPVSGGSNGYVVAVTPLVDNAQAGDKFQLMWATTSNSSVSVITEPSNGFSPQTPGVIVSVIPITNIITAPPGTNTSVVFNDSGVSNALSGFTFTKTTNSVTVANNLYIGNTANAQAFTVNGSFTANSTGVNAASFTINTDFSANSTLVNAAALLVRGGATVNGTLTVNALSANGGVGSAGQALYSDGTKAYWNVVTVATNTDAQYTWSNTHTFQNTVTFGNSSVNTVINSTSVRTTSLSGNLVGNVTATTITGNLTGNVAATTISGNLTGNVVATTITGNLTGNVVATTISGNLTGNVTSTNVNVSSNVVVGNSTVFVYSNTTAHVGNVVATAITGNLTGNVSATTISGNLTGNVAATTISGNLTGNVAATTISGNLTGNVAATVVGASANVSVGNSTVNVYANATAFVGNVVATTISGNLTGNVVATTISGNLTGNVVATTISGNLTGNVAATTISGNLTGNVASVIVSASSNVSVGNSTVNVYANATAFVGNVVATTVSGNLTGNVAATTISGNLTGNVVATTITGNLTGNVAAITISGNLTGNVVSTTVNATANIAVGNSTVNVYANSTLFVGNTSGVHTGNVEATTLTGNLTGNVAATTITGNLTGNVVATTISGNLTGNVSATAVNTTTVNATSTITVGANVSLNTSVLAIGNSTANVYVNSTAYVGNVVATTITGNLTGNVAATTISGNLTGNVSATTISGNLTAITANVINKLQIGTPGAFDFGSNAVIEVDANGNTYVQSVLQNSNTGNNASTDLVITNDTGNDSVGYVDLGINGSNYNQPGFSITGAGDAYLYAANGHLAIGTASDKEVILHAGGTTSDKRMVTVNSTAVILANAAALVANGSKGTAAQILTSNGTGVYWTSSANNALNLGGVAAASYQLNSTLNSNIAAYLPTYTGVVNASTFQVGTAFKANTTDVVTANLTVQGNLIVTGTTVTLNTATLDVKDLNITLAKGTATAASANGAGITVDTAFAEIVYVNAGNTWLSNIGFAVGNSTSNVNINSTAFIGNVVGTRVTANLTGNVTATTITGNLTGNVAATTLTGNLTGNVAAITITGNLTGNVAATTISGNLTGNVVATTISGNLTGNVVAGTVNATTINATSSIVLGAGFLVNTTTLNTNTDVNLTVNNKRLSFTPLAGGSNVYFIQQSDDNFVFYSTNTLNQPRPVFSVFANSVTSNLNISVPVNFNGNVSLGSVALSANGSTGSAGQVLVSNGTATYWAVPSSLTSVNVAAQYAWTNTHTFSANVSFTGNGIGIASNTGALYLAGIADANWKIGRNTGSTTKWIYTNNTIDVLTPNSTNEGFVVGLVGGNSYLETGYLGTYIASNVTVGNSTVKITANSTAFIGNVVATAISGNLTGNVTATTITGNLTGNVVATTISGNLTGNVAATTVSASANISLGATVVANTTGTYATHLGGTAAASFVQNTDSRTLSGNLVFSGANNGFSGNVNLSGTGLGLTTNSTALYFNGISDANWRIGRNTGGSPKWFYTGNTIDIIAANTATEGIVLGFTGNSYLETGYGGTFIKDKATVGNSTVNVVINATTYAIGTAFTANTTVVNAVSYNAGTRVVANATVVNATHLAGLSDGSYLRSDASDIYSGGVLRFYNDAGAFGNSTGEANTLQIFQATASADAFQTFHVSGDTAVHFGLDGTTNDLFVGGWSFGANKYKVWHQNNDGSGSGLDADTLDGSHASSFQTTAGLSANVATLTSNNASYLGTVAAASYVQNTDSRTLSGNLNFTGSNTTINAVFRVVNATSNVFFVAANGNVGIQNNTPAHDLRVEGPVSLAGAVSDITTLAAGNTTITGFANVSGNGQFMGNVSIGAVPQSTVGFYHSRSWATNADVYGSQQAIYDTNTAMTVARTKYNATNLFYNYNQNKSSDGLTTYGSAYYGNYSAMYNGNPSTGGDASSALMTGIFNYVANYANGASSNTLTTARGTFSQIAQYGTGVMSSAEATRSRVLIGNSSVANITTAYTYYADIFPNTSGPTIGTGYLFFGNYVATGGVTTRYGISITNESYNYFSGNVGIANTAPAHKLRVDGATSLAGAVTDITTLAAGNTTITGFVNATSTITTSAGANGVQLTNATSNWIGWNNAGVGVPTNTTTSAGTKLMLYPGVSSVQVDYAIGIQSSHMWFSAATAADGFKWYANTTNFMTANTTGLTHTGIMTAVDFNSTSDIRFKSDIEVIDGALDKVNQLNGYTFTMNETGERSTGLIAQEVEKVLPEAVKGDDKKTLSYGNMVGLLVEAIKEQNAKIERLEAVINNLKK